MPTFCSLAGYEAQPDLKWNGVDLSAVPTKGKELPDCPLYAVAPGSRARSFRLGDWKQIVSGAGETQKIELFNLAAEPTESYNAADEQPRKVAELRSVLKDDAEKRDRYVRVEDCVWRG